MHLHVFGGGPAIRKKKKKEETERKRICNRELREYTQIKRTFRLKPQAVPSSQSRRVRPSQQAESAAAAAAAPAGVSAQHLRHRAPEDRYEPLDKREHRDLSDVVLRYILNIDTPQGTLYRCAHQNCKNRQKWTHLQHAAMHANQSHVKRPNSSISYTAFNIWTWGKWRDQPPIYMCPYDDGNCRFTSLRDCDVRAHCREKHHEAIRKGVKPGNKPKRPKAPQ